MDVDPADQDKKSTWFTPSRKAQAGSQGLILQTNAKQNHSLILFGQRFPGTGFANECKAAPRAEFQGSRSTYTEDIQVYGKGEAASQELLLQTNRKHTHSLIFRAATAFVRRGSRSMVSIKKKGVSECRRHVSSGLLGTGVANKCKAEPLADFQGSRRIYTEEI